MEGDEIFLDLGISDALCEQISFEDAIAIQKSLKKGQKFPCRFEIKDDQGRILILNGVNRDTIRAYYLTKDRDFEEVFSEAVNKDDIETVRILFNAGIPALNIASLHGKLGIIKMLLEKGANVNEISQTGKTPLIQASYSGNKKIVETLLEHGADANISDTFGYNPLIWASRNFRSEIVKMLLEKGANVNAAVYSGHTALYFASLNCDIKIVKMLLEKGANVNAITRDGHTALNLASRNRCTDVMELLRLHGAAN